MYNNFETVYKATCSGERLSCACSLHFAMITCILLVVVVILCEPTLSPVFTLHFQTQQSDNSCQSVEGRQNALLSVRDNVSKIIAQLAAVPQCGDGLWYTVTSINMSNSTQECPSNWTEISTPARTCGRPESVGPSCPGVYFSVRSQMYSKVCGRVIGYQDGSTDGFYPAGQSQQSSVDSFYVDGLSITHGSVSRTHIWTYAIGAADGSVEDYATDCLCSNPNATVNRAPSPSFVGDNYFCESGNHGRGLGDRSRFFENDPVWDGEQCEGDCCNGKSPPWFSVTLPNPTMDDIEVRICGDEGTDNEDSPIQLLEIYIQ